jgi:hypothetical protein
METEITLLTAEAVKLKDQALLWVYISEWLAVTSTSIFAGFTLWTLMVRRRKYRTTRSTRLRSP